MCSKIGLLVLALANCVAVASAAGVQAACTEASASKSNQCGRVYVHTTAGKTGSALCPALKIYQACVADLGCMTRRSEYTMQKMAKANGCTWAPSGPTSLAPTTAPAPATSSPTAQPITATPTTAVPSPLPSRIGDTWAPTLPPTLAPTKACVSWRQTGGCSPDGRRERYRDKTCGYGIEDGWSGYCECAGGRKAMKKGCAKGAFRTCNDACSAPVVPTSAPTVLCIDTDKRGSYKNGMSTKCQYYKDKGECPKFGPGGCKKTCGVCVAATAEPTPSPTSGARCSTAYHFLCRGANEEYDFSKANNRCAATPCNTATGGDITACCKLKATAAPKVQPTAGANRSKPAPQSTKFLMKISKMTNAAFDAIKHQLKTRIAKMLAVSVSRIEIALHAAAAATSRRLLLVPINYIEVSLPSHYVTSQISVTVKKAEITDPNNPEESKDATKAVETIKSKTADDLNKELGGMVQVLDKVSIQPPGTGNKSSASGVGAAFAVVMTALLVALL